MSQEEETEKVVIGSNWCNPQNRLFMILIIKYDIVSHGRQPVTYRSLLVLLTPQDRAVKIHRPNIGFQQRDVLGICMISSTCLRLPFQSLPLPQKPKNNNPISSVLLLEAFLWPSNRKRGYITVLSLLYIAHPPCKTSFPERIKSSDLFSGHPLHGTTVFLSNYSFHMTVEFLSSLTVNVMGPFSPKM